MSTNKTKLVRANFGEPIERKGNCDVCGKLNRPTWASIGPDGEWIGVCANCIDLRSPARAKLDAVTKQRDRLREALIAFSRCNLTDENCASLEVANQRIRNLALTALAEAKMEAKR